MYHAEEHYDVVHFVVLRKSSREPAAYERIGYLGRPQQMQSWQIWAGAQSYEEDYQDHLIKMVVHGRVAYLVSRESATCWYNYLAYTTTEGPGLFRTGF